jgi:hypothetical protein
MVRVCDSVSGTPFCDGDARLPPRRPIRWADMSTARLATTPRQDSTTATHNRMPRHRRPGVQACSTSMSGWPPARGNGALAAVVFDDGSRSSPQLVEGTQLSHVEDYLKLDELPAVCVGLCL